MKVERIEPKKPQATIHIEIEESDAEMLCALIGGIQGCLKKSPLFDLFHALSKHLPKREKSFSDFFTGEVSCK